MVQTELAREISYGRTPLNYGLSLEDFSLDFSTILSLEGILNEEDPCLSLEAFDPKMNGSFIRDVFESECKNLKIDMRLAKTIQRYAMAFVTKNEEHIQLLATLAALDPADCDFSVAEAPPDRIVSELVKRVTDACTRICDAELVYATGRLRRARAACHQVRASLHCHTTTAYALFE